MAQPINAGVEITSSGLTVPEAEKGYLLKKNDSSTVSFSQKWTSSHVCRIWTDGSQGKP